MSITRWAGGVGLCALVVTIGLSIAGCHSSGTRDGQMTVQGAKCPVCRGELVQTTGSEATYKYKVCGECKKVAEADLSGGYLGPQPIVACPRCKTITYKCPSCKQ